MVACLTGAVTAVDVDGQIDGQLVAGLVGVARQLTRRAADPVVLSRRPGDPVVRAADVVVKAHPRDADPRGLEGRLRVAALDSLAGVLLPPLRLPNGSLVTRVGDRLVSAWSAGEPVDPDDPDAAPWEQAARLLARLHAVPVASLGPLAGGGAPARVRRAVERMRRLVARHPAAAAVRAALATLPGWALGDGAAPSGRPVGLTHGDWHLGQMVRLPGNDWRLVDVDDLGLGDPAWDLGRPAAWYAAGLLPPEVWARFLDSYRDSGGIAVPRDGDPWQSLDVPARALMTQSAALAVAAAGRERRDLDEVERVLVETCRRIADHGVCAGAG